jgi:hypothetical protein
MTGTRKPAPLKPKRAKKTKSEPRVIQHRSLGQCTVLAVFLTDGGGIVVDADVAGACRTLSLAQEYWLAPVDDLLLEAVKRQPAKEKPAKNTVSDDDAVDDEAAELTLNSGGHLAEDDAGDDEEEVESEEDAELIEVK